MRSGQSIRYNSGARCGGRGSDRGGVWTRIVPASLPRNTWAVGWITCSPASVSSSVESSSIFPGTAAVPVARSTRRFLVKNNNKLCRRSPTPARRRDIGGDTRRGRPMRGLHKNTTRSVQMGAHVPAHGRWENDARSLPEIPETGPGKLRARTWTPILAVSVSIVNRTRASRNHVVALVTAYAFRHNTRTRHKNATQEHYTRTLHENVTWERYMKTLHENATR